LYPEKLPIFTSIQAGGNFRTFYNSPYSLISEGVDRIGGRGLDGLRANRQQRDQQCRQPGQEEHPHLKVNSLDNSTKQTAIPTARPAILRF
ncbi:MAG: hypothetical protein KJ908_08365, partial [Acidobacteria bacterium]|nr:hypothetical protein [Acidobacteriota bacterium]